jgi:hypothetical protein
MSEPRQRPIPVTRGERDVLDTYKRKYQDRTGETPDWGKFLGTIVLLGLAAAGIYGLARATRRSTQSVDVQCCECQQRFLMAVPSGTDRAVQTMCPHCNTELVVDLGTTR